MKVDSKDYNDSDHGMDLLSIKEMPFGIFGKRRGLLLVALIFVLIPLWGTFAPLFEFILFAISLAALTYPVFYRPIYRVVQKIGSNLPSNRLSSFPQSCPL